ncbi:uncharacterized protein KZ484_019713 [Pholidichthys leucotaenia]
MARSASLEISKMDRCGDCEDDLDILTTLLDDSEGVGEDQGSQEDTEDLDGLLDEDTDGEEYKEGVDEDVVSDLFGDVDDITKEEEEDKAKSSCENSNKSKEDLQEELRRMEEQVLKLQQQLEASQEGSAPPERPGTAAGSSTSPTPAPSQRPVSKLSRAKPAATTPKTNAESVSTCQGSTSLSMNPQGSPASVAVPASVPTPIPAPSTSGTTRSSSGKRKRSYPTTDLATVFAQMHGDEVRLCEWQLEQHREALAQYKQAINRIADDAREAMEQEAALRREEMTQTAVFNQDFLAVVGRLLNVMGGRHV